MTDVGVTIGGSSAAAACGVDLARNGDTPRAAVATTPAHASLRPAASSAKREPKAGPPRTVSTGAQRDPSSLFAANRILFDVDDSGPIPPGCDEPCWISRGPGRVSESGHRHVSIAGRRVIAHRYAYERAYGGPIPEGLVIHHECDNKLCVNVTHLEAVTRSEHMRRHPENMENAREVSAANRRARTHCKRGHALSGSNVYIDTRRGSRRCRACIAEDNARRLADRG